MVTAPRTNPVAASESWEASPTFLLRALRSVNRSNHLMSASQRLIEHVRLRKEDARPRVVTEADVSCRIALLDLDSGVTEVFAKRYAYEEAEEVCAQMNEYYGEMFEFSVVSRFSTPPSWFKDNDW